MVLFAGDWLCIVLVFALMSPLFRRCPYRKAVLFNTAWAVYLFELSLCFWVHGYDVWSLLYFFLPMLASILISLSLLFRMARDKTAEHRWRLFAVALTGLLAQCWTLFWVWMATDYNAFGASC